MLVLGKATKEQSNNVTKWVQDREEVIDVTVGELMDANYSI